MTPTVVRADPRSGRAAVPHRRRAILLFDVGDQLYGIPLADVREVLPMAQLLRPPALPSLLAGLLNLDGVAFPVLRLDRLFGVPEQPTGQYTPLLILRHEESPLALLVSAVRRIVLVADDAILPVRDYHAPNECVEGILTIDDHMALLLSSGRILSEKEQQCVAELQDREQSRLRELESAIQ